VADFSGIDTEFSEVGKLNSAWWVLFPVVVMVEMKKAFSSQTEGFWLLRLKSARGMSNFICFFRF
jgi:hypothetical protein